MSDKDQVRAQALSQVQRIAQLYDFVTHPAIEGAALNQIPVSMPRARGSLGFDDALWAGMGIVGLWAAMDALAERASLKKKCNTCGLKCIGAAFEPYAGAEQASLDELEDLRHLYAHNFAGHADELYFKRRRHILRRGDQGQLSCNALFDNGRVVLQMSHLPFYADAAKCVIERVD